MFLFRSFVLVSSDNNHKLKLFSHVTKPQLHEDEMHTAQEQAHRLQFGVYEKA